MGNINVLDDYNAPRRCKQCDGIMIFKGVGEYQCEDCGFVDYDDYGKARMYIESHRGANAAEIERATGVSQRSIRKMLRESRLEVAEGSRVYLRCEACGKEIRSGRFCSECEGKIHRKMEKEQRELQNTDRKGFGRSLNGEDGQRRFMRGDDKRR